MARLAGLLHPRHRKHTRTPEFKRNLAVIARTTEYYGLAVDQLRRSGRRIDDEVLAHISPAHRENVNFFGAIEVDPGVWLVGLWCR
ncbi:hypothetical protein FG87_24740 [Nocardia vulneris]|uniref:Tn3 transposase DDE domain-containing protein n=1 Tax=Nocardia vulneris TaxID=1141657 RepID=A0ABR4ZBL5_9NOCA|nr:Tn3 family transposase [Nocardia vulneris]KIA62492.1 hypothetical protein FG87_24740 [Nocardia vulneris]